MCFIVMYEASYMKYMNIVSSIYKFQNIAIWIQAM